MSNYQKLKQHYQFPFELRDFQIEDLETFGDSDRFGCYYDPGLGKTVEAIAWGMLQRLRGACKRFIVLVPPIVFNSWVRSVTAATNKVTGQPLSILLYRGTPKKREELRAEAGKYDFVCMTWEIFKNDFMDIAEVIEKHDFGFLADEAQAQKNVKSGNHKALYNAAAGRPVMLMTGSPTTKPNDAYAYMRLTNPNAYRNYNHFLRTHVESEDGYGNPSKFINLEVLNKNFLVNSVRRYKRDHLKDLPAVQYIPMFYDLDPAHYKLYKELAEQKLLELEGSDEVIDALSASRLMHALQQIVVNYGHFTGNPAKISNGIHLVEEVLDEIGDEKLLVVSNYKMTNKLLLELFAEKYGAVGIYGDVTHKQRDENVNRFVTDKGCRLMVIEAKAGGVGLDGLQHVCSEGLFLECSSTPKDFYQAAARLDRSGQTKPINWRIAVANKTLQVRRHVQLLGNDELVQAVEGGTSDLRKMIYGE